MSQAATPPRTLLRRHGGHGAAKVGMVELFFDLVFVFAVTQLSHALLGNLTQRGALQTVVLLFAVWSLWNYTAWATNALDPERIPVRTLLFVLMAAGLALSISIPQAFGSGGRAFAVSYVGMHAMRASFVLWAARDEPPHRRRNFLRNLFWVVLPAPLWLAGANAGADARLLWWAAAVGAEFLAPWLLFWTPGLGASSTADWLIDGAHMAERCALFVIIALGESLLITGATFAAGDANPATIAGLTSAFLGTVAMWWIYFHEGAEHAAGRIDAAVDRGRMARSAYSYVHILIVAGIIVCAVGDELVLTHAGHANAAAVATVFGGTTLFVAGCAIFKWLSYDRRAPPLSHMIGLLALGALFAGAHAGRFTTLQLGMASTAVLVVVAGWEALALRRR